MTRAAVTPDVSKPSPLERVTRGAQKSAPWVNRVHGHNDAATAARRREFRSERSVFCVTGTQDCAALQQTATCVMLTKDGNEIRATVMSHGPVRKYAQVEDVREAWFARDEDPSRDRVCNAVLLLSGNRATLVTHHTVQFALLPTERVLRVTTALRAAGDATGIDVDIATTRRRVQLRNQELSAAHGGSDARPVPLRHTQVVMV